MSGATVYSAPEDLINAAFVVIGYKRRMGSIYEGTEGAKLALDVYGQERDNLLRAGDWGFARGDIALTLLKTAPAGGYILNVWTNAYPPLPWKYSYSYPSDALKIRGLRTTPIFIPNFDPQPASFDEPNDNSYSPAVKVIVTNVQNAIATYTRQITNPTTWEPSFTQEFIAVLAKRFERGLGSAQAEQIDAVEQVADMGVAEATRG